MTDKILVIDDDPDIAKLINLILKPRGLITYHAVDGQDGLKQAYELQPDLIILDIMMPVHDGYEVCARLRELSDVPILMLTAKSQASDVTRGFAVGADDYVKKPFSNEELVSRIESLLRRKKTTDATNNLKSYSDGYLEVELASQKVTVQGEEISLTPTELKLLSFLIRHPNKTLPTRTLLTEVWGDAYSHEKSLLSLYVHQLRQKLKEGEAEHKYIQTQWGQGYCFNPLLQTQNPSPVPMPVLEKQIEQEEKNTKSSTFTWGWIFLAILIILIAIQLASISNIFPMPVEKSTSLEAIVTADGFIENDITGVRGQICISNRGKYSTERLSIMNTVQVTGEQKNALTTTAIDLGQNHIIEPDKSYCYPYEVIFDPILEPNVSYANVVRVTISNYRGLAPGSEHCPGPDPCSFGPTLTTEFTLPEP